MRFLFSIVFIVWATLLSVAQTAHYVSLYSTPGPNRYTSVQAAVDASSAGDTVYVEGGNYTDYITITKDLVVIGVGWNIAGADSLANTNLLGSLISRVIIRDNCSLEFSGITFTELTLMYDSTSARFTGCNFMGSFSSYSTGGVLVFGSIFNSIISVNSTAQYFHLYSSIVRGGNVSTPAIKILQASDVSIKNSVVIRELDLNYANVQNCILSAAWQPHSGIANTGSNCLFVGIPYQQSWGIPNSSGGYTYSELFESTGSSVWGKFYQLKSNSPAIGAGTGGTDCGIFGGSAPFVLGGIPPIPWIHQLNLNSAGSHGGGVDVNVKVRAQ